VESTEGSAVGIKAVERVKTVVLGPQNYVLGVQAHNQSVGMLCQSEGDVVDAGTRVQNAGMAKVYAF
jgi:hypothetical protein